jgi:hypothetical protein
VMERMKTEEMKKGTVVVLERELEMKGERC